MARRRGVVATLVQIQREAERDRQRRARDAAKAQRDAERAAAARSRAAIQDQKLRDRMYAEDRAREAAEETAQLEQLFLTWLGVISSTIVIDVFLYKVLLNRPPA
jgi:hypothetical protein